MLEISSPHVLVNDILRPMSLSDDWEHPDLVEISRVLQRRFDAVLDAEQAAAASLARRSTSIHDRMLEAESRRAQVIVGTLDGVSQAGRLATAAFDHIELANESGIVVVPTDAITWVAIR